MVGGRLLSYFQKVRSEDRGNIEKHYITGVITEEELRSTLNPTPEELSRLQEGRNLHNVELSRSSSSEQEEYATGIKKIRQEVEKENYLSYIRKRMNADSIMDIPRLEQNALIVEDKIEKVASTPDREREKQLITLQEEKKEIDEALRSVYELFPVEGGIYALHKADIPRVPGVDEYSELGTVPLEIPPERAAQSIQRGNEVLRKCTQVAYDLGKIDEEEYKQRMGRYCDNNPCGKCIVYQLTCVN